MCIQGGFKTVTPIEISNVPSALGAGIITTRGARVYLGCLAMVAVREGARRCELIRRKEKTQSERFHVCELSRLTAISETVVRKAVRNLERQSFLKFGAKRAGLPFRILDQRMEALSCHISVSTMHHAKGREFCAVAVMACDDEIIPLQERSQTVGDDADLQEVYETERHFLYVACTRARDHLLISSVSPASDFIEYMRS